MSASTDQQRVVAQVEEVLLTWVYPQRKLLAELVQQGTLTAAEVQTTLRRLTEAATHTLGVERTSVWRIRPDGGAIECLDLFERSAASHSAGAVIEQAAAPSYFHALATERVIAAHDAREDPRTAEFRGSYLEPLGITSMLDAPVYVKGRAIAVVCHEHVGPARRWQFWEELVASTFADFVTLVLEAESRARAEEATLAYALELERKVEERTLALRGSEQNLKALLDATPVSLVLARASDHMVAYANERALAMFDVSREHILLQDAGDFWVEQEDRQGFRSQLLTSGRVDDLEVQLRARSGRVFWARMSAQALRFDGELMMLAGIIEVSAERQAGDNLREIFANAPVALILSRLKDGVLLDGNQRAVSLFDVPIEEARGGRAPEFWVHPEDRDRLQGEVQRQGRVDGFEAELQTQGGRRFWAELSASVVQVDGSPALLVGGADISSRKRAEEALRRREIILRTLLDAAPTPLVVTRLSDGVLQYGNTPAAEMFETPIEQLIGRRAPDFYANHEDRLAFIAALREAERVDGFSAQLRTSSGRVFWALLSARMFDLDGEPAFMVGFAELSAQKALEEQLRTLATVDGLTGVNNRRHFLELAEAELARAARYGHATSIAMLDLDHFKAVNDELGHAAGDAVLSGVAALLREQLRGVDVLGRVGGEEFALLLPETERDPAAATLDRVRRIVGEHVFSLPERDHGRGVTVSIGLARAGAGETLAALLRRADAALYRAKSEGRNRLVVDETFP